MMEERPHISLVATVRPDSATRLPQLMSLSQGSLVIRAHTLLEPGQKTRVTIHFSNLGQEIQIDCEVVWANHALGDMAMRFTTLSEGGREAIAQHIADRSARR